MKVVKVISTKFSDAKIMLTKLLKSGKSDVQEVKTSSLPGIDSVPLKDLIALYETSDVNGENFVIGFLVANRKAEPGEVRLFSLDDNNTEKIYLWLKKDGTIHFGGDSGNLTRYQELETAFNDLQDKYNDLAQKWTTFTSSYIPGGPTVVGSPPTLAGQGAQQSMGDITGAKIDELKTL